MKVTGLETIRAMSSRVDALPIDIQSAVAEGLMASESSAVEIITQEYGEIFLNVESQITAESGMEISLNPGDVGYFKNVTGADLSYFKNPISEMVLGNIRIALARNTGGKNVS